MRHRHLLALGAVVLASVWVWPLPFLDLPPFAAHMTMHMAVVAVAAPLLALGVAGGRLDPATRAPAIVLAVPASLLELVAVWAWHAPGLHHAARTDALAFGLEQASFLASGFFLWAAAVGGPRAQRRARAVSGLAGLLLTSMHMTLLGALIALTPRVLYAHAHRHVHGSAALSPLVDQQLGGAIMLVVGGAVYLLGGLGLTADLLLDRSSATKGQRA